tara:strand:+ start:89 stop:763 length:675 start_codon:yes stop_codon:yes gene_type:complete
MKLYFKYLFILLFGAHGQLVAQDVKELMRNGYEAVQANDYNKAQSIYLKVVELDSTNMDAFYNLASIELARGNKSLACDALYKLYGLGDSEAKELILQNCGPLEYNDVMNMKDITEVPRITIKGKTYDFIIFKSGQRDINERFKRIFIQNLKKSKAFKGYSDIIFTAFQIDKYGVIKLRIKGKNLSEKQIEELKAIYNGVGEITPAKFQDQDVGVGYFSMPLRF